MLGFLARILMPPSEEEATLERTAWHETGHIIGSFLVRSIPTYACIKYGKISYINNDSRFESKPIEYRRICLVGGWALERQKRYDIEICKDAIGYGDDGIKETWDWHEMGRPTIEEMDALSKWFNRKELAGITKKIHKELLSKRKLYIKHLKPLYREFMEDARIRSLVDSLEQEIRREIKRKNTDSKKKTNESA